MNLTTPAATLSTVRFGANCFSWMATTFSSPTHALRASSNPATSVADLTLLLEEAFSSGGYSPLIGIVTAIVGNILISVALNTQRYAHIRLSREEGDQEKAAQNGKSQSHGNGQRGYGTDQAKVAEERATKNGTSTPAGGHLQYDEDRGEETDALIPRVRSRSSAGSSGSRTHQKEKSSGDGKHKSYLRSPWWWLGISLMAIGEAGNFLAYGFAPASIVSPLGVVALISNCMIAPIMLKEKFRKRDALGVLIAGAGAVTVVLSAEASNPTLGPHEIWKLIKRWEFETYLVVTIFLIICLMAASNRFGHRTIMIDLGLVALFGGYTALSTKGVASLLSYTLWRALTFPISYLLLAVLVGTAIMQIKYVNRALQRFDSTQVIPVQFVLFTISVIVGSAILYRDFEKTTASKFAKFVGGCALTFLGVWCVTGGREQDSGSGDEESVEEEDTIRLVDEERYRDEVDGDDSTSRTEARRKPSPPVSPRLSAAAPMTSVERAEPTHSDLIDHPHPPSPHRLRSKLPSSLLITFTPDPQSSQRNAVDNSNIGSPSAQPELQSHPPSHPAPRPHRPELLSHTLSAPSLPLGADTYPARPTTIDRQTRPSRIPKPTTPTRPSTLQRGRASITSLMPEFSPLTNPLSASFRVVVADSLRRGLDLPAAVRRKSESARGRPTLGSLRQAKSAAPDAMTGAGGVGGSTGDVGGSDDAGAETDRGRPDLGRSKSATLGRLLGFKKGKGVPEGGGRQSGPRLEGGEAG